MTFSSVFVRRWVPRMRLASTLILCLSQSLLMPEEEHHPLSNIVDDYSDAKTMFTSQDMLQQRGLARALSKSVSQRFHSTSRSQPTKKPESKVTGNAFTGVEACFWGLAFEAPFALEDFFALGMFARDLE